jgi:hypothetical protein
MAVERATVEKLAKRRRELWARQETAREVWQELADYVNPNRSSITVDRTPGQKRTDKLFESSGPHYANLLAASLAGTLISSAQKWFDLETRQQDLNELKPVKDWLEEVADVTYLALNQSNFTSEATETLLDLVCFGTGCLFIETKPASAPNVFPGLQYQAIPIGDYAIAEGPDGRVNTLYRRLRMTTGSARALFGDDKLGPDLLEKAANRPDDPLDVYHAVYPREGAPRKGRMQSTLRMPFASCYFTEQPMRVLEEGGFHEFPFAVPRWRKIAGEVYGQGPAHIALPDIRTLNEAKRLYLEAATLAIRPPLLEQNDGTSQSLSLEPAARNVVEDVDRSVKPMDLGGHFDVAAMLTRDLNQAIAELFFIPQLRLKDSPAMTATEVVQRQEETQRLLGPTAGRLHSEMLTPTVERTVALEARGDALPPMPQELAESDADIDVTYEGPLARAQKALDLVAIERTMAYVSAVFPMKPEVLDLYDFDAIGRHVGAVTGLPSNLVFDPKYVEQIRAARAKQQQGQAMLQLLQGGAEAAGKAAPMARVLSDAAGNQAGVAA